MLETLLQAILEQIDEPKKDLEKNLRALLNEAVEKLDLVSKQEIDRQKTALQSANQRLEELQKQKRSLHDFLYRRHRKNRLLKSVLEETTYFTHKGMEKER